MIITITGPNDFARKEATAALVSDFVAAYSDMALERLDGEYATADRMVEAIASMPFLTEKKMVVLTDASKQRQFTEQVSGILASMPDTTDLIIIEPKLDKRLTYYKTLKKQTDFREYAELDTPALSSWIVSYVAAKRGSISAADAGLIIERLGVNQYMIRNELDKLLAYGGHITKGIILELTELSPQGSVFELLDLAFSGNASQTLALYEQQRTLRVEPQAIIGMLAWQLHILALIKASDKRPAAQIAQEAHLNPFVVRKSQGIARRLDAARLRKHIHDLLQLDVQLKRAPIDADEALQYYLLQLGM